MALRNSSAHPGLLSVLRAAISENIPTGASQRVLHNVRALAPAGLVTRSQPYRKVVAQAAAMWLATRAAYLAFTYFAVMFQSATPANEFAPHTPLDLVTYWQRWDAIWYTHIAQWGYWTPQATAFFPLYPVLIKAASFLDGQHYGLAALVVSNLGALIAFVGIALLAVQEERDTSAGWRAVRVLAAYPLAFFLVAPYTESLFLGFAALAFFFARGGSWRWAAVWTFLAGLTRPTGLILAPPLVWEYGRQHGWWAWLWERVRRAGDPAMWQTQRVRIASWWQNTPRPVLGWWHAATGRETRRGRLVRTAVDVALVVAAVPAAILVYMLFLELRFGHPLYWLHVQTIFWRRDGMPIWSSVSAAVGQVFDMPPWTYWQARQLVDLGPVLLFGAIMLVSIRRVPVMYTIYMVGLIYLAVSSPVLDSPDPDMLISAGRFLIAAIPVFLIVGRWTKDRPALDMLIVTGGFLVQAVLAGYFLNWGWLI